MSAGGFSFRRIFLTDDSASTPVRSSSEIDVLLNDALHPSASTSGTTTPATTPVSASVADADLVLAEGVELAAIYAAAVPDTAYPIEKLAKVLEGLNRRGALVGKTVAIDAALASMPDKIEEIYQMVIAAPYSKGMGGRLEDSLSRLRLAEELEQELSFDLSDTLPSGVAFGHAEDLIPAVPLAGKERAKASARQTTLN